MAIYSLHHQPIGKTTQARPHTSAAHVRYITRPSAVSRIEAERMPNKPGRAVAFMVEGENADRKNARVSDKLMLALPRELTPDQRAQLVCGFAEDVTQGRAPWLAAFHDKGKDAQNPHAHVIIRDRDPVTGKRVAGLSEKGSTDRLRELWERHANRALEAAGRPERIDRRTLEAQGIERAPFIHEGPKAQQMDRRGASPESQVRIRRNAPGARSPARQVDYHRIDGGRSRPGYNRDLPKETPADYWSAIDADRQGRELAALRAIHHPPTLVDIGVAGRELSQDTKNGVIYLGVDCGRLAGALLQPSTLGGLMLGPSGLKPTPDRIARVPGHNPLAEPLLKTKQPSSPPLQRQAEAGGKADGKIGFHDKIMGRRTPFARENLMDIDDEDKKRRRNRLIDARGKEAEARGIRDDKMNKAYINPKNAEKKMEKYRAKHGDDALNKELADSNTQKFGRRPGSILSLDGYKPGASQRRDDSHNARRALPEVRKQHEKAKDSLIGANHSYGELEPPPGALSHRAAPSTPASSAPKAPVTDKPPEARREPDKARHPARLPSADKERVKPLHPHQLHMENGPFSTLPKAKEPENAAPKREPDKVKSQEVAAKPLAKPLDNDRARQIMDQQRQKREREKAQEKEKGRGIGD